MMLLITLILTLWTAYNLHESEQLFDLTPCPHAAELKRLQAVALERAKAKSRKAFESKVSHALGLQRTTKATQRKSTRLTQDLFAWERITHNQYSRLAA